MQWSVSGYVSISLQTWYKISHCIRCTTLLPPFFSKIRGFIVKNWLYIYDSKYCPSLVTTFSHLAYESRVEKTDHLLRLSTNPIFYFFIRSAGQPGRVPLIETSDSQREQRLENTAGGVGLSISTFPSMSWPLSQHGVEHCHAAKSLYRVSRCIAAVCLSMLGSNASIAFDTDRLWLFQSVLTVHNTLRRAVPPNAEHDLGAVNIRFGRRRGSMAGNSPWFSALGIIVMNPFFISSHNAMQKSLPSLPFKQLFTSKQTPFNIFRLQFVWHPISLLLNHSHGFEAFWNGLSHSQWSNANSSWFWHESCSNNTSNSASSKTFSLPPLCRSSTSKSPFLKRNHSRSFINSCLTISIWEHLMNLSRRFLHIEAKN